MWNTSAFMQINKKKRIKIKMKMKKIKGQKGHKRKCREVQQWAIKMSIFFQFIRLHRA